MNNFKKLEKFLYTPSEDRLKNVRNLRNRLLQMSDWTQGLDSPLSDSKKAEWAAYRQSLRDITNQNINNIVWPEQP